MQYMSCTHGFDMKETYDEVSMGDYICDGDSDVGVLLGSRVGPVLCTLHLERGE